MASPAEKRYHEFVSELVFPWEPIDMPLAGVEPTNTSANKKPMDLEKKDSTEFSADKKTDLNNEGGERFDGVVRTAQRNKGFGFIKTTQHSSLYFNQGQYLGNGFLAEGDNVSFFLGKNHKGDVAKSIVLLSNSTGSKRKARAMRTPERQEDVGKRRKATREKILKCKKTNL